MDPKLVGTPGNLSAFMTREGLESVVALDEHADATPEKKSATTPGEMLAEQGARKYNVGDIVARGGMGLIYSATDVSIRRCVAMKAVMPEHRNRQTMLRFIEEAQVTGQLEHPSIVPVYELAVDSSGSVFYTMKFVRGITLKDIIDKLRHGNEEMIRQYPLRRLLRILEKVCDAVAYAHSKKVVHRDLKPENIMVGGFGEVLLMDWGLAKVLGRSKAPKPDPGAEPEPAPVPEPEPEAPAEEAAEDGEEAPKATISSIRTDTAAAGSRTMDGQIMGTPQFMPPEQAAGKIDDIDCRSDIYALGGVLYNILTLHPPIEGKTVNHILVKVASGEIKHPSEYSTQSGEAAKLSPVQRRKHPDLTMLQHCPNLRVPESLAAVAMKALAKAPEDRYQSVTDLQADIEAYQAGFATAAEEASLVRQLCLMVMRHKIESSLLAASILILGIVVAGAFVRITKEERLAKDARDRAVIAQAAAEQNEKDARRNLAKFRDEELRRQTISRQAAPEFLEKARRFAELKDAKQALHNLEITLSLDSRLGPAWYLQGVQQLGECNFADAETSFAKTVELGADDPQGRAAGLLAAVQRFRSVPAGHKQRPLALRALAETCMQLREPLLAALLLKRIPQLQGTYEKLLTASLQGAEAGLRRINAHARDLKISYSTSGLVVHMQLRSSKPIDISALRGLPLTALVIQAPVRDLAPIEGLALTSLDLTGTGIADLGILRGMRLGTLSLSEENKVRDLKPLAGMPLESLKLGETQVEDLTPLKGMKLHTLDLWRTKVKDISALRGMPLKDLCLGETRVETVVDLRGMPLEVLGLWQTRVTELSPLWDMALVRLDVAETPIKDIAVLRTMPLRVLKLSGCTELRDISALKSCTKLERLTIPAQVRDIAFLRNLPALRSLNTKSDGWKMSAAEFWRKYDAGELRE